MLTAKQILKHIKFREEVGDRGGSCFGTPLTDRLRDAGHYAPFIKKRQGFEEGRTSTGVIYADGGQSHGALFLSYEDREINDGYKVRVAKSLSGSEPLIEMWKRNAVLAYDIASKKPFQFADVYFEVDTSDF